MQRFVRRILGTPTNLLDNEQPSEDAAEPILLELLAGQYALPTDELIGREVPRGRSTTA